MTLPFSLTLASKSPRRRYLLQEAGFDHQVKSLEADESFPPDLAPEAVARYIAIKKAEAYKSSLLEKEVVITADTVVILDNQILGKPVNNEEAKKMLIALSGKKHKVVTGVCLTSLDKSLAFDDTTIVSFKSLNTAEIDYYIANYRPFDKAGAYGAQEWMGMIAIERIEGSYFNVMGLPIHLLYDALKNF